MASPAKTLRILCFGDSLTAGYSGMGAMYHPYSETLEQMVAMAFPEYRIETVEDGKPGDLASSRGSFLSRMGKIFAAAGKGSFDWTIVLGGTNDLAWGIEPEEIFDSLEKVWAIPLAHGSRVLALTVPEAGVKVHRERIGARRDRLNGLIKGYQRDDFHTHDLHASIPYFSMTPSDRALYWDDAVHLTPDGYDLVGRRVGTALVSLLVRERTSADTPARRRRVFRDDDRPYDEEGGDPAAIDQGYVIVRRKDLDYVVG